MKSADWLTSVPSVRRGTFRTLAVPFNYLAQVMAKIQIKIQIQKKMAQSNSIRRIAQIASRKWPKMRYLRKPNCAHLASDSVVDQATSSVLQAARCSWSSSSCAPNQLKIIRQKTKLKDPFDVHHDHEENSKKKSKSKTFLFLANKQGGPALAIFSCSKKYDPGASVVCILGMRCQSIAPKKAFGAS